MSNPCNPCPKSASVLYLHRVLGRGGDGIHVVEMIRAFRDLGVHVLDGGPNLREFSDTKLRPGERGLLHALWRPRIVRETVHFSYNLSARRKLRKLVETGRPDLIYERYGAFSYLGTYLARRYRLPHILEVNTPEAYDFLRDGTLVLRRLGMRIERAVLSGADAIVVPSPHVIELLDELGLPAKKVAFIPNGVDPVAFHPRTDGEAVRRRFDLQGRTVVGFVGVGTARSLHALDVLFAALRELFSERPELAALIVGDSDLIAQLRVQAQKERLPIMFAGRVPHEAVPQYIAAMDITIATVSSALGLSMKLFEYMAMGKPVIGTRWKAVESVVDHEHDGLLVANGDRHDLRRALLRLVDNPDLRERLGRNARRKILARHTWRRNAERVLDLFGTLI